MEYPTTSLEIGHHQSSNPASSVSVLLGLPPTAAAHTPVGNTGVKSLQEVESEYFPVHIDWITFTICGDEFGMSVVRAALFLEQWTGGKYTIGQRRGGGVSGYTETYRIVERDTDESPDLGWVGASESDDPMRGWWCFSLNGTACSYLNRFEWTSFYAGLLELRGRITRLDIALDDLEGKHPLSEMEALYDAGAFTSSGRPPSARSIKHKGGCRGDTFYVGERKSGKLGRGYEKGKQLGDPCSPWVRYEVEFHHGNGRIIPLDVLLRPAHYLKGAYRKAFAWIPTAAVQLHAMREKARITFERAEKFARRQAGRIISYMRECLGLGDADVVARLTAGPGRYPSRLWEPALDAAIPWDVPGGVAAF